MWLTDLKLVLEDGVVDGALRVLDGHIAEVVVGQAPQAGLSARGLYALPGLIDLHGDMLERDIEPRPGARFPTELALYELDKRLASSGITTAYAAVSFAWTTNDLRTQEKAEEIIRTIGARRAHLLVDTRVHARFEIGNPETAPLLERLLEEGLVELVSLMDHTPGQGQYKNVQKYVDFMTRWLGFDPEAIGADMIHKLENAVEVEAAKPRNWGIVREVAEVARRRHVPLASHDDDTEDKVEQMARYGVTISEFPVSLEAARAAHQRSMGVVMGAPNAYRGQSSGGNLGAVDAIRASLVDALATDYFPASLLQAAFRLAELGILPLHESVKLVSSGPARLVGLTDRGRLAVGQRADLVLVEADSSTAHPRVRATLRQGHFIYQDGVMARLAGGLVLRVDTSALF
ncbi:MAG: phosphonate metabolism protein PhnM [Anaerolineae bacterium]|nr:phosphonate metabolism protein PhnM [Anaerolineae bacterium]MDW8172763.1 phosphonate metabolism protein PhnM [Anaerolineae bacterium]